MEGSSMQLGQENKMIGINIGNEKTVIFILKWGENPRESNKYILETII